MRIARLWHPRYGIPNVTLVIMLDLELSRLYHMIDVSAVGGSFYVMFSACKLFI